MGIHTKRRKKEFSKLIIVGAGLINLVVIVFTVIMIWMTGDLTPLCYLIPSVGAEFSAGTVAYYAKAKVENRIKLMRTYGVDPSEQAFSDNF